MSDAKRWSNWCAGTPFAMIECDGGLYVLASDYDRVVAERDALLRYVQALEQVSDSYGLQVARTAVNQTGEP